MDTVGVHEVEKCMEKISAENTIIHWIDAGYTWKLQTLDVGINRPFKDRMRKEYNKFMFQQVNVPVEERRKIQRIDIAKWVSEVWNSPGIKSLSIMKTWAHIGIKSMIKTLDTRTPSVKIQL